VSGHRSSSRPRLSDEERDLAHSTIAVHAAERELLLDRLAEAGPGGLVLRSI
jgi:hypothetical protein